MPQKKYFFDDYKDRLVREAYASPDVNRRAGPILALSAKLGIPRAILLRRARKLGLHPQIARYGVKWTAEQDDFLLRHAHLTPEILSQRFAQAGMPRSPSAVAIRLNRMHRFSRNEALQDQGLLKEAEVCRLLGVHHRFLSRLIESGDLPATREGQRSDGRAQQWLIREADIRNLIVNYTAHINFARVDKYWLVDLLTRSHAPKKQKDTT